MAHTFRSQIAANRRGSAFLCFLMTLLLAAVGAAAGYLAAPEFALIGASIALAIGIALWIFVNTSGPNFILQISGAREATHEEDQILYNVGHEVAIAAGIPMPKLYVIEDSAPNAFATGMDPRKGIVCVTTGLLEKLNRDELQGVVAHEIAHIRNNDTRLMTTLALTVGMIVLLRDAFLRSRWRLGGSGRGRNGNQVLIILAVLLLILAPFFATLLHFAVSRKREYLADATAAQLTRYPDGLARALEKIASDPNALEVANKATEPMYIVSPFQKFHEASSALYSTHPPIRERIRRLRAMGIEQRTPEPPWGKD